MRWAGLCIFLAAATVLAGVAGCDRSGTAVAPVPGPRLFAEFEVHQIDEDHSEIQVRVTNTGDQRASRVFFTIVSLANDADAQVFDGAHEVGDLVPQQTGVARWIVTRSASATSNHDLLPADECKIVLMYGSNPVISSVPSGVKEQRLSSSETQLLYEALGFSFDSETSH